MSLQLILGKSGAGKSHFLYNSVIDESIIHPDRNYIVVVPEQNTMSTQKKLVSMHPKKGILNIDVVSFERLAFKVFDEVGEDSLDVLDDTGKNLIIRRILEQNKKSLKYFSGNIGNQGFVSEMKSVISELIQYNVSPDKLSEISSNDALNYKLNDIKLVYNEFNAFIDKNYITKEEILDRLCLRITESEKITQSEIVFDGFTGFTPIQYKLLAILLKMCPKISITLTADPIENNNVVKGMEDIFFMSKECISKLHKICDAEHVQVCEDIHVDMDINSRFNNSKELLHLENNIFRNSRKTYNEIPKDISIYSASVPKNEILYAVGEIVKLTRKDGYRYKDIAIVSADLKTYGKLTGNILKQNDIPFFLDNKKDVIQNPLIVAINSVFEIINRGYSYSSVMAYLKTGMADLETEEIDYIDNYCLAVGIKNKKHWTTPWEKKFRGKVNETDLKKLNELREKIVGPIEKLENGLKESDGMLSEKVKHLYDFIVDMRFNEKLSTISEKEDAGEEYKKVYEKVIEVLDKMFVLLGTEKVSNRDFAKILSSGFEEIKIGLIPQNSDAVLVGDIERTRLDDIKIMFFVGINDGNVPKKIDSRSVLSEMDRETIKEQDITLSPLPREQSFIQRFYLYLVLTKPSEKLYLSYSNFTSDNKELLPSYLIRNILRIFPKLKVLRMKDLTYHHAYIRIPKSELMWNDDNVFKALSGELVSSLIGENVYGSVTSFEKYATCQFAYFLQYEMGLSDREEFSFEMADFGTILHSVIENVSRRIKKEYTTFADITDEQREKLVDECTEVICSSYANTILTSSGRNEYMIKRMKEMASRTMWAILDQLRSGTFVPEDFEASFIEDVDEKTTMHGFIDRIDICEDEENVYVKVVDYKTGQADYDLVKNYYGLKIQLITYMRAAMEIEKKRHPDKNVIPAGFLYYHMDNPIVEASEESEEEILDKIRKELKMKGIVNSSVPIIKMMDNSEGASKIIPVSFNKSQNSKGEPEISKSSKVMSTDEINALTEYTSKKAADIGKSILGGNIERNPIKEKDTTGCTYCIYQSVCGFSEQLNAKNMRRIKKFEDEILWKNIKEGIDENGKRMDHGSNESN